MSQERRVNDREPVVWLATLTLDDDSVVKCEIRDVSYAGTMISSDTKLDMGEEVLLTIKELGDFAGTVKWIRNGEIGLTLMGGPNLLLSEFAASKEGEVSHKPSHEDFV